MVAGDLGRVAVLDLAGRARRTGPRSILPCRRSRAAPSICAAAVADAPDESVRKLIGRHEPTGHPRPRSSSSPSRPQSNWRTTTFGSTPLRPATSAPRSSRSRPMPRTVSASNSSRRASARRCAGPAAEARGHRRGRRRGRPVPRGRPVALRHRHGAAHRRRHGGRQGDRPQAQGLAFCFCAEIGQTSWSAGPPNQMRERMCGSYASPGVLSYETAHAIRCQWWRSGRQLPWLLARWTCSRTSWG